MFAARLVLQGINLFVNGVLAFASLAVGAAELALEAVSAALDIFAYHFLFIFIIIYILIQRRAALKILQKYIGKFLAFLGEQIYLRELGFGGTFKPMSGITYKFVYDMELFGRRFVGSFNVPINFKEYLALLNI